MSFRGLWGQGFLWGGGAAGVDEMKRAVRHNEAMQGAVNREPSELYGAGSGNGSEGGARLLPAACLCIPS